MNEVKKISIVVSTIKSDPCEEYCDYAIDFNQQILSLEDILKEEWFLKELESRGFYSSNMIYESNQSYLNKYIFKIKNKYWNNFGYTESLNNIDESTELLGVYQQVVNHESIEGVKQFNKARKKYLEKIKKYKEKEENRKKLAAEKRRLKQIEKAKKILEENECKS